MTALEASIEIPAVNFPSLDDGFYEAESIRQKRVCRRNVTLQEKHDPADALLTNRFGFINAITERWKDDGKNIFLSFRGFRIHNGAFKVLIENIVSTSINTSNTPL
jgi:hypothetical protein